MPPQSAALVASAVGANSSKEYKSLALRLHKSSPCLVYVFIKKQQPHPNEQEVSNALYVTGLPLGLDDDSLAAIFSCFGPVQDVVLHPSKRSAAVVYSSPEGVSTALSQAGKGQIVEYDLPPTEGPVGLKAWVVQHKALRPGNSVLQQQLDEWIEAHDAAEAAKEAARTAAMSEDGWTVVVRSKGRKRAREAEGVSTQRDKRRNELMELRQRFDEGRKQLAARKAQRHFKPS
eukprot:gene13701-13823_t